ncbi:sensor histidine kinase [Streptosporangium saharense]|uniref:sensor histidine kinase n=1 Tax=Streptosporangium saharense TaxID=1706840 RepID=UPI001C876FB1|nr:histidine kinase [Streptosporangium saharense]
MRRVAWNLTSELSPRTLDVLLALAATAATVVPTLWPRPAEWWVVALAFASSAPVLWRRRAPVLVSFLTGLAMTGLVLWEKPFLPWGPLIGVYTIAALSGATVRLLAVPFIGGTVYLSLVMPGEETEAYRMVGTAFVAAYALGTSTRARAAGRAERAERDLRLEQEQEAAAARERTRIARDVHDIVTHSVGLMVVQAEAGSAVLDVDPTRARTALDAVAETGRTALVQLRGLLGTLRDDGPVTRTERPSLAALPELVRRTRLAGLDVRLLTEGRPGKVAAETEVTAYRVVQEALTNVVRHAGARAALVTLGWTATHLTVTVADDGKGDTGSGGGHGLRGMRERVTAGGGVLRAGTSEDGGFVVRAELPRGVGEP